MSLTIDELFYGAYRDAGLILVEGVTLNPDQKEECRRTYNRMADAWGLDGLLCSHVARTLFDIVPSKGVYSMGPAADWDMPKYPVRVERASVILTNESPQPELPIFPLSLEEFQDWRLKDQTNNWPRRYYYEPSFPLANFWLLYVPADGNKIALYLEDKLIQLAAVGDQLLGVQGRIRKMRSQAISRFVLRPARRAVISRGHQGTRPLVAGVAQDGESSTVAAEQ